MRSSMIGGYDLVEWTDDDMISCDDFVKMNEGVMNWLWWFWENEWGRDIVGTDDFEKWMR